MQIDDATGYSPQGHNVHPKEIVENYESFRRIYNPPLGSLDTVTALPVAT